MKHTNQSTGQSRGDFQTCTLRNPPHRSPSAWIPSFRHAPNQPYSPTLSYCAYLSRYLKNSHQYPIAGSVAPRTCWNLGDRVLPPSFRKNTETRNESVKSKRVLRRCGRRCASRPIWVKCGHISHERTRTDGESRRRPGRNYPLFIAKRLRRGKKVQEEIIDEARPQGRRPCFSTSRFEYPGRFSRTNRERARSRYSRIEPAGTQRDCLARGTHSPRIPAQKLCFPHSTR